jgi:hypothetical protein
MRGVGHSKRWCGLMQFDVNLARDEVYECGAALLTVLACAKEIGDERSLQLYLSLCAKAPLISC